MSDILDFLDLPLPRLVLALLFLWAFYFIIKLAEQAAIRHSIGGITKQIQTIEDQFKRALNTWDAQLQLLNEVHSAEHKVLDHCFNVCLNHHIKTINLILNFALLPQFARDVESLELDSQMLRLEQMKVLIYAELEDTLIDEFHNFNDMCDAHYNEIVDMVHIFHDENQTPTTDELRQLQKDLQEINQRHSDNISQQLAVIANLIRLKIANTSRFENVNNTDDEDGETP